MAEDSQKIEPGPSPTETKSSKACQQLIARSTLITFRNEKCCYFASNARQGLLENAHFRLTSTESKFRLESVTTSQSCLSVSQSPGRQSPAVEQARANHKQGRKGKSRNHKRPRDGIGKE